MKTVIRLAFYSLLLYACYVLLSAMLSGGSKLPKALQEHADAAMQQYLCQLPISWRIGELDPAFSLTLDEAEQTAHNAAMQWNKALGFEVFRYDSIDGFPINFSYDERQQQLLQQALLQRNIARYDQNIDERLARLNVDNTRLRAQQQTFEQQNREFAADVATFEQKARQAGSNRDNLLQEQQQLQLRQQQLTQQADALNAEQARLAREQRYLNDTVADRNALLPQQDTPATAPEVGLMEIQGKARTMTIFAYKTLNDLQLTMAHEFGHAIGVNHTEGVTDVMHFAITNQQHQLTENDIQAAKMQCGW